jgi:hypothetical protein
MGREGRLMGVVTKVEAKGEKAAILVMDDGARVWTPDKTKADDLVGKPIPPDWTQKTGDYGPQAFPPKKSGGDFRGSAAWRNTKEGAWFEAVARAVNTAVMQAKDEAEAEALLRWSIHKLKTLTAGGSTPPRVPPAAPSSPSPGSSPGDGAPRQEPGGKHTSRGKLPASPAPDSPKKSENPWEGMPEFG